MGTKIDVGVLRIGVSVTLRGEGNIAAVGRETCRTSARRARQLELRASVANVIRSFQAEMNAIGWSRLARGEPRRAWPGEQSNWARMRGLGRIKRIAWLMLPVASSSALKSSGAMGKPAASALVHCSPRPEVDKCGSDPTLPQGLRRVRSSRSWPGRPRIACRCCGRPRSDGNHSRSISH